MTIGNPATLAIESGITEVYENPGLRALGYFVLYIGGALYGVLEPDATLLANSFDEVERRIGERGIHVAPFDHRDPTEVAACVIKALYAETAENERSLGLSHAELKRIIYEQRLLWVPDGDEAFDDASFVLQFDCGDRVRLIAFKRSLDRKAITDVKDVWMASDDYYGTLSRWLEKFRTEWGLRLEMLSRK